MVEGGVMNYAKWADDNIKFNMHLTDRYGDP